MKRIRHVSLLINVLVIICTLLAFASPVVHPGRSTIPALMGLLFPALVLVNVLAVLLWAAFKQWYFLLSLACLVIGWTKVTGFVQLGPTGSSNAVPSLTVATYNIHQMSHLPKGSSRPDALRQIREALLSPDVLCIQEGYGIQKMQDVLDYPHLFHINSGQTLIFSKFPILNSSPLEMEGYATLSGWVDLALPSDTIRLFTLYLSSSRVTAESEQIMKEGNFQDKETWKEIGSMLNKYADASVLRARQADLIAEEIARSPFPVVVCGDFNDIPQSYTYHRIRGKLADSFLEKGQGIGTTYAGKVPWLRIDYVLTDPDFDIISHHVPHLETSDHYPVVSEIRITDL